MVLKQKCFILSVLWFSKWLVMLSLFSCVPWPSVYCVEEKCPFKCLLDFCNYCMYLRFFDEIWELSTHFRILILYLASNHFFSTYWRDFIPFILLIRWVSLIDHDRSIFWEQILLCYDVSLLSTCPFQHQYSVRHIDL